MKELAVESKMVLKWSPVPPEWTSVNRQRVLAFALANFLRRPMVLEDQFGIGLLPARYCTGRCSSSNSLTLGDEFSGTRDGDAITGEAP